MAARRTMTEEPDQLRPLNLPQPVRVECRDGLPTAVTLSSGRIAVVGVVDAWLVEDEWWRQPIARYYRHLLLDDDRLLTVFEDRITGAWYRQHYSLPVG